MWSSSFSLAWGGGSRSGRAITACPCLRGSWLRRPQEVPAVGRRWLRSHGVVSTEGCLGPGHLQQSEFVAMEGRKWRKSHFWQQGQGCKDIPTRPWRYLARTERQWIPDDNKDIVTARHDDKDITVAFDMTSEMTWQQWYDSSKDRMTPKTWRQQGHGDSKDRTTARPSATSARVRLYSTRSICWNDDGSLVAPD